MYQFKEIYPRYDVGKDGVVYKDGNVIQPFKSNGYSQVVLFDANRKRKVCGVHTVVAMKYLDFFDGCVVHHIDGNTQNNCVDNLEVHTRAEHTSIHSKGNAHKHGVAPWNKGKKMSEESRIKMSESARNRKSKGFVPWNKDLKLSDDIRQKMSESAKKRKNNSFRGNQYVDKYGNKR